VSAGKYTAMLGAGLGMVHETRILLELWSEGADVPTLQQTALQSGRFPGISARRLENIVSLCFAPRYLRPPTTAATLKRLQPVLSVREFVQCLYLYACRANPILADFVVQVYWPAYSAGKKSVSNEQARDFVKTANAAGMMAKPWTDSMLRRGAGYLTGSCADFGLLAKGQRTDREFLPFRIEPRIFAYLAYDLHFAELADPSVINHPDWQLFGLGEQDVLDEMKRQSPKGLWFVQSAGALTRITWQLHSREEVIDAFLAGEV